jgi:hypothetical protein
MSGLYVLTTDPPLFCLINDEWREIRRASEEISIVVVQATKKMR